MKRVLALALVAGLGLTFGCLTEEGVEASIEEAGYCTESSDCVVIYPGCPLGCFAAVNAAEVEDIEAKIERYHRQSSNNCIYDCAPHADPFCENGQCIVEEDVLY